MSYEDVYRNMIFRAEIKEILENDGSKIQKVKATGYAGEELEMLRLQTHGFSSRPSAGALAYAIAINGRRENAMLIGGEMPGKRLTVDPGGAVMYDDTGNFMRLSGNKATIKTAGATIELDMATNKIKLSSSAGVDIEAPSASMKNAGGGGGGQFDIGGSGAQVNLGGTGGKRLRLEDGSLSAAGIKAVN